MLVQRYPIFLACARSIWMGTTVSTMLNLSKHRQTSSMQYLS